MSNRSKRLAALPQEKRLLLEKMLKEKQQKQKSATQKNPNYQDVSHTFDVAILGGGLSGLTLALQLLQARPETHVLVVEKNQHPVPEAAFKVGESTVEVGAYYLGEMLGLKDHIQAQQLPKFGLRFFFSANGNYDITERVEMGATAFPPVPSYQLDRGRFENKLGQTVREAGVTFWDGRKIKEVIFSQAQNHLLKIEHDGQIHQVAARWVVDATGQTGFLKRHLGIGQSVSHKANAVWFRLEAKIDLEDWTDNTEWLAKVPTGKRWFSTHHLLGEGYWVWLIPLASGGTSIGIVTDPTLHPAKATYRAEKALAWLHTYEPQCAHAIADKWHLMQDFRAIRNYAHRCERVFSQERWCLTGIAGVFSDPFYSPGTDYIALSNTLITDMIVRELAGENIIQRLEYYNQMYLSTYDSFLQTYENQYPIMGNGAVMAAKITWDFSFYWGFLALLFFHNKFCDLDFMVSIADDVSRLRALHEQVQLLFREWSLAEKKAWSNGFIDVLDIDFLLALDHDLVARFDDNALQQKVKENVTLLERIAVLLFNKASGSLLAPKAIDPYKMRFGVLAEEAPTLEAAWLPALKHDLAKVWLDKSPQPSRSEA